MTCDPEAVAAMLDLAARYKRERAQHEAYCAAIDADTGRLSADWLAQDKERRSQLDLEESAAHKRLNFNP